MKAIIELDVPEYQIGEKVSIYFKDTMMKEGIIKLKDDAGLWCDGCLVKYHKFNPGDNVYYCEYGNKYEAVIIGIDRRGYVIRIEPIPGKDIINLVVEEDLIPKENNNERNG